MGAWHKTGDIEQFDGHGALAVGAGAVVRAALLRQVVPHASAVDLQVSNGSLRIDRGESVIPNLSSRTESAQQRRGRHTYGKLPAQTGQSVARSTQGDDGSGTRTNFRGSIRQAAPVVSPIPFSTASGPSHLFSVVDFLKPVEKRELVFVSAEPRNNKGG